MAITAAELTAETTSPQVSYASPDPSAITLMSICNTGQDLMLVDVHVVPSGSGVGTQNMLIKELELQAGDTYILYHGGEKLLLDGGDLIMISAVKAFSSANDVGITIITSHVGI